MQRESISYMMLFCALVVARKNGGKLEDAMMAAPLSGNARLLAGELLQQQAPAG